MRRSIAIVTPTFPPYRGGIGKVAEQDAVDLSALGFDVHVFAPSRDVKGGRSDLRGFAVQGLHTWARIGNGAFVPGVGKLLGEFDLVVLHYPFYGAAEPLWLRKKLFGGKLLVVYHMDVVGGGKLAPFIAMHTRFCMPRIVASADKVLVTSMDYATSSKLAPFVTAHPAMVKALPPGVDVDRFKPGPKPDDLRRMAGIPEEAKVVLMVGGLDKPHYFKGIPSLIAALGTKELANIHAVIVGQGELRASFEAQAHRGGVSKRMHFVGGVDDAELPGWYRLADVFAFPSIDRSEAFGIAALEAASSGLPIVASDLPGVRTIVRDTNGIRVTPGSSSSLALGLMRVLGDDALRTKLGSAGREMAVNEFGSTARRDKWIAVMRDLFGTL